MHSLYRDNAKVLVFGGVEKQFGIPEKGLLEGGRDRKEEEDINRVWDRESRYNRFRCCCLQSESLR